MRVLMLPILAGLAGCAQTPAQTARAAESQAASQTALAKTLAGLTPGKSSSCMPIGRTSSQVAAYGPTIVYTIDRNLKYRSDTTGGCEGIARDDILVTKSYTGTLCSGDIAQTVDRTSRFQTGSCSFGPFVPYRKGS